jgi:hypothetical protein
MQATPSGGRRRLWGGSWAILDLRMGFEPLLPYGVERGHPKAGVRMATIPKGGAGQLWNGSRATLCPMGWPASHPGWAGVVCGHPWPAATP